MCCVALQTCLITVLDETEPQLGPRTRSKIQTAVTCLLSAGLRQSDANHKICMLHVNHANEAGPFNVHCYKDCIRGCWASHILNPILYK